MAATKSAAKRKTAKAARPATVAEYLETLPPEKREVIDAARRLVREHIRKGYAEYMNWGVRSGPGFLNR